MFLFFIRYVRNRIDHWCTVEPGNPNPRVHRSSGKLGEASFPTGKVDPRVGISLSPMNTNDGFSLSPSTTLLIRVSARELLVPFLTPLVWRYWGVNPRSTAPKADALTTRLSGLVNKTSVDIYILKRMRDKCIQNFHFREIYCQKFCFTATLHMQADPSCLAHSFVKVFPTFADSSCQ